MLCYLFMLTISSLFNSFLPLIISKTLQSCSCGWDNLEDTNKFLCFLARVYINRKSNRGIVRLQKNNFSNVATI